MAARSVAPDAGRRRFRRSARALPGCEAGLQGLAARQRLLTYSIVARDAESGELGVAVQSRAFRCGGVAPWAMPGVGAVATQSLAERSYGPLGLELLRSGKTPEQALAGLVAADPEPEVRQVAILAADGAVAVHTGAACIREAGHRKGEGYSVQANIMKNGGDWRGRQAAGLLVVPAGGQPWETVHDLRVDDHPEPLEELRRLLRLDEGYVATRQANRRAEAARAAGLAELDVRLAEIFDAAHADDVEHARELLAPLLADEPRWANFVRMLAARGLIPHADELVD